MMEDHLHCRQLSSDSQRRKCYATLWESENEMALSHFQCHLRVIPQFCSDYLSDH